MNNYSEKMKQAVAAAGSYAKLGRACNVSGQAVQKWVKAGKPPRTEYTGETDYATRIAAASAGAVSRDDLLPAMRVDA